MTGVKLQLKTGIRVMDQKEQVTTVVQSVTMAVNSDRSTTSAPTVPVIDISVRAISVSELNIS